MGVGVGAGVGVGVTTGVTAGVTTGVGVGVTTGVRVGVTTGVGMRRGAGVSASDAAAFNRSAISGHLVGLVPPAGDDIVRAAGRLLQEADSLRDRADAIKGGLTGTLRVGASPQHIEPVLAPFVTRFRRKHPGIEVHFVEDGGARISDRLAQGVILAYARAEWQEQAGPERATRGGFGSTG